MSRPYRYLVVAVHDPDFSPPVEVGTVLREDRFLGLDHTYQVESKGNVRPWITVEFLERVDDVEPHWTDEVDADGAAHEGNDPDLY